MSLSLQSGLYFLKAFKFGPEFIWNAYVAITFPFTFYPISLFN